MTKAIFLIKKGQDIPSMDYLVYDDKGTPRGGFTIQMEFEGDRRVWIETSPKNIKEMKKKYKWLKNIE